MTKIYTFINPVQWADDAVKHCFNCKKKGYVPQSHIASNEDMASRGAVIVYTCLKCLWSD